ncbi:uncharacterized protein BX664DRAFT_377965 [Halteromyces radiatus]|uniref:uncharacterized protein n=1 Tax=Halteromyces radiatus TaxID=101107 RepID=UPI00221E8987|nr:uncharacterized protein BX664DRAFT_377965 [Halteromyces radiatus]KAI8096820.1 hypothetical protein BX664DRAFT_377965 [Halteromyces radiatus]
MTIHPEQQHLVIQLPELISQILWFLAPYHSSAQPTILHRKKRLLHPCLFVNRLWHDCTVRHLWKNVVFEDTIADLTALQKFTSVLSQTPIIPKTLPISVSSSTLSSLSIPFHHHHHHRISISKHDLYRQVLRSLTLRRLKDKDVHFTLMQLAKHTKYVERLELYICDGIQDDAVMTLISHSGRYLTHVSLAGCCQVTDATVLKLARDVPQLTHLDVRACGQISDISLIPLATGCPQLTHLNVGRVKESQRITSQAIICIAQHTQVKVLGLAGCAIDDDAIIALAHYRRGALERISVNHCQQLTNHAIHALRDHCLNLLVFEMKECYLIDDWSTVDCLVARNVLLTLNDHQKRLCLAWGQRRGKDILVKAPIKS